MSDETILNIVGGVLLVAMMYVALESLTRPPR